MDVSSDHRRWIMTLLEAHERKLTRFALRIVGDENLARDAVQHAFMRLCDETEPLLGDHAAQWLYRVVRNRALDLLRERSRTTRLEDAPLAAQTQRHDPAESAEEREIHETLRGLVGKLPDDQRETLALWSEGFSYREIAAICGKTEGHLRILVHRAVSGLRHHPAIFALFGRIRTSPENAQA